MVIIRGGSLFDMSDQPCPQLRTRGLQVRIVETNQSAACEPKNCQQSSECCSNTIGLCSTADIFTSYSLRAAVGCLESIVLGALIKNYDFLTAV